MWVPSAPQRGCDSPRSARSPPPHAVKPHEPLTVPIDVIVTSVPLAIAVRVPLVIIGHVGAVVAGIPKGVGVRILLVFVGEEPAVVLQGREGQRCPHCGGWQSRATLWHGSGQGDISSVPGETVPEPQAPVCCPPGAASWGRQNQAKARSCAPCPARALAPRACPARVAQTPPRS